MKLWRIVGVTAKLTKFTLLTRGHSGYLTDHYSERKKVPWSRLSVLIKKPASAGFCFCVSLPVSSTLKFSG
ncbi:hypothetical protein A8L51_12945 [Pantoea stewartii]|nr:hypothetical protein [Pantoea stewartii]